MPHRNILYSSVAEAEHLAGDGKEPLEDSLELEVGAHFLGVEAVVLCLDHLRVVEPVPDAHILRLRVVPPLPLNQEVVIGPGRTCSRIGHLLDELPCGPGGANHLVLRDEVSILVIAQDSGELVASGE